MLILGQQLLQTAEQHQLIVSRLDNVDSFFLFVFVNAQDFQGKIL